MPRTGETGPRKGPAIVIADSRHHQKGVTVAAHNLIQSVFCPTSPWPLYLSSRNLVSRVCSISPSPTRYHSRLLDRTNLWRSELIPTFLSKKCCPAVESLHYAITHCIRGSAISTLFDIESATRDDDHEAFRYPLHEAYALDCPAADDAPPQAAINERNLEAPGPGYGNAIPSRCWKAWSPVC